MGMQPARISVRVSGLFLMGALAACGAKPPPPPTTAATTHEGLREPYPSRSAVAAGVVAEPTACELTSVYFEFDSSSLDQRAKDTLASDHKCAKQRGAAGLRVVGMTDPRGTEEYNLALGDRRARAAARYLNALGGSAPEATSVGAEMANGADESGWARDRRADLQVK